jgi:hypothetical protein
MGAKNSIPGFDAVDPDLCVVEDSHLYTVSDQTAENLD